MKTVTPETLDSFQYGPRGVLRLGDRFRVSGGPYYKTETGKRVVFPEPGVLRFIQFVRQSTRRAWIVAVGPRGYVSLWVGAAVNSPKVPGMKRRPYRIRKVRV